MRKSMLVTFEFNVYSFHLLITDDGLDHGSSHLLETIVWGKSHW